jgi:hypothetical protein
MRATIPLLVGLVLAGCTGGSGGPEASSTLTASTTVATTTVAEPPAPPPPLTHRVFIKGLDGICRRSNRLLDRRFGAAEDAAIAANDYDRLADLMKRANRFDRPFYRAVNKLGARVPERDEAGLRRYLRLSRQLDIFGLRYIRALRAHDDDELGRLNTLIEHTRNKRTRVTATMGLRQCGS